MRKRSKYKPKGVRLDNMAWIKQGMQPMRDNEHVTNLRIKNHAALLDMAQGRGSRDSIDVLIAAMNVAEALAIVNYDKLGGHLLREIDAAQNALDAMGKRSLAKGVFRFTGPELQAMNTGMEIHDQQLDTCNIAELERAIVVVQEHIRNRKARAIA